MRFADPCRKEDFKNVWDLVVVSESYYQGQKGAFSRFE